MSLEDKFSRAMSLEDKFSCLCSLLDCTEEEVVPTVERLLEELGRLREAEGPGSEWIVEIFDEGSFHPLFHSEGASTFETEDQARQELERYLIESGIRFDPKVRVRERSNS